jgi:hypothetical protein
MCFRTSLSITLAPMCRASQPPRTGAIPRAPSAMHTSLRVTSGIALIACLALEISGPALAEIQARKAIDKHWARERPMRNEESLKIVQTKPKTRWLPGGYRARATQGDPRNSAKASKRPRRAGIGLRRNQAGPCCGNASSQWTFRVDEGICISRKVQLHPTGCTRDRNAGRVPVRLTNVRSPRNRQYLIFGVLLRNIRDHCNRVISARSSRLRVLAINAQSGGVFQSWRSSCRTLVDLVRRNDVMDDALGSVSDLAKNAFACERACSGSEGEQNNTCQKTNVHSYSSIYSC